MEDFKASPEDIARFLHYISQLESSGGKNTEHSTITSGIHAGDAARGEYGLMPNTREEMMRKYRNLASDSSDKAISEKLAEEVLNKAKGDEALAATMWQYGHNTPEDKFQDLKNKDRYNKYNELRKEVPEALDSNPYLYRDKYPSLNNILPHTNNKQLQQDSDEQIRQSLSLNPDDENITEEERSRRKAIMQSGMDYAGSTSGITRLTKELGPEAAKVIQKTLDEMPAAASENYMGALRKLRQMLSKGEFTEASKKFNPEMSQKSYREGASERAVPDEHAAQGLVISKYKGQPTVAEALQETSPLNRGLAERSLIQKTGQLQPDERLLLIKQPKDISEYSELMSSLDNAPVSGRYSNLDSAKNATELREMLENNPLKELGSFDKLKYLMRKGK